MTQKNASFILLNLLLFLPVPRLLGHPQKLVQISQSNEDSFTNTSQSNPCRGCRKLLSRDPPTTAELSDRELISTEATTLLGDADVDSVYGNQDSNVISNSTSAAALVSTQPSSNFDTDGHKEKREDDEGRRTTLSEMLGESRIDNSEAEPFTVFLEDSRSLISTSRSSLDVLQSEDSMNERSKEDLDTTRVSDTERFWDSGDTHSIVWLFPQKVKKEDDSHLEKQDSLASSHTIGFKVSESAKYVYPVQTNAEVEESNSKSYAYAGILEMNHEPLRNSFEVRPHRASTISLYPMEGNTGQENNLKSNDVAESYKADHRHLNNILANDLHPTQVTNTEQQANLFSNFEEVGDEIEQSLQHNQPIKIREENSEIINDATKTAALNGDNNIIFKFSPLQVPLQNSDKLQENREVASSTDTTWNVAWNRKHLIFPETIPPKVEEPVTLRQVNGEGDVEDKKSDFSAENRDMKPRQNLDYLNVSTYSTATESPAALTNVNGFVIEDSTKRPKINRTLNILRLSRAECEKGSGSCLACREISPHCHYNYRGKMCFYDDAVHGNAIYECGIRFFTVDGYQTFFYTLLVLIVVSLVAFYFLSRAFYRRILQKDPVTDMEVQDMRNVVHLIRDKRGM